MTAENKVIIVGAGMGGLTAGAYLAREGFEVLLLEKNDRTGGLVTTFEQGGFSFDAGPRAFVNSGMVKPMLRDLGIEWDYLGNRISIGIEDELVAVESMASLGEYQRILEKLYPGHEGEIKAIIEEISKLSEYTRVLYEFDNPSFVDFRNDPQYIFRELLPWLVQFLRALRKLNRYGLPVESFLAGLTESRPLLDLLTQLFFRSTPTNFALGYFYVYQDYFYPRSGTGALPRLLEQKIFSAGGQIQLRTEVMEVRQGDRVVLDAEGKTYPYDHLIWAADLKSLYQRLTLPVMEPGEAQRYQAYLSQLDAGKGAESVFILFLAVDRPTEYFRERGGEHLFYSPSRAGLGSVNREEREELLANFKGKSREEVFSWLERFVDNNTFEVSVPALRDPSLAPPGQTGLMISCLFDYQLFEKVREAGWYDAFKETLENRIIDNFSRTIYPDFREDILFQFSSTPLTIRKISGSSGGAITGWSFETPIPVIHQLADLPKSAFTPLEGIYQAGQWAYAPAGVPIAMLTGWHASQKIIKQRSRAKGK